MKLINIIKIAIDICPIVTIIAILGCACSLWILITRLYMWIISRKRSWNEQKYGNNYCFASWGERLSGRAVLVMSLGWPCFFLVKLSYEKITMGGVAARPLADLTQLDVIGFFVPIVLGGIAYVLCLVAEQIGRGVSQRK